MEPAFATRGEAVMVSNQAPGKMHSTNEGDDTEGGAWEAGGLGEGGRFG
jgi:hypothetical protein